VRRDDIMAACILSSGQWAIFMKRFLSARLATLVAAVVLFAAWAPARADVMVQIDKSAQRMSVSVDGVTRYNWPVSTGRDGYGTPSGTFHPQAMMRSYFSRKYYNAPMPHAIFFYYGFAIHGTNNISQLGGPASHGCVRLHPSNAATLFSLVQRGGPGNTTIHISN
jgi:lipoprotein-anchoring transpeptidase ErfK/SrfK